MKKIFLAALVLAATTTVNAQLQTGKENINKLCGCFDVDFKYAETFSPDTAYKFKDRSHSGGTELVIPVETSDKKIVLQHLLIAYDTMIIKHWREDWVYEPTEILVYKGNKQWVKQPISKAEAKGKWLQTVWEVDDAPRYQGLSSWVHVNGKTYWENTANAPLPRREYTKRSDYQILKRGNKIIVNDSAWYHEQDNDKIIVTGNTEKLLAQEKGMNAYVKISDSKCANAKAWWQQNLGFWNKVRQQWDAVLKVQDVIVLKSKVDEKRLDQYFTDLQKQYENKSLTLDAAALQAKFTIEKFVSAQKEVAAIK